MRPRLNANEKRNCLIGIKVKKETRQKLEFIAAREAHPLSTQIDLILCEYIENYLKISKINWNEYKPDDEKEGILRSTEG